MQGCVYVFLSVLVCYKQNIGGVVGLIVRFQWETRVRGAEDLPY